MIFTPLAFSGATFFADVRPLMTDRALFAGSDGDFRYIVFDGTFYRFEMFMRPAPEAFVAAAIAAETARPALRVITSGSFIHDYGLIQQAFSQPVPQSFEGEVIAGNHLLLGQPASKPDHRYLGRLNGATTSALVMDRGNPSDVSTPRVLQEAMGSLLPIIKKGVPFGPTAIYDPSGANLLIAGSGAIHEWMGRLDGCGKIIVGVHRASDIAFVLVQEDGYLISGESILDVIARLHAMGVDDAVMGDGSDSVTLVIDGTAQFTPKFYKDNSLTTGFAFARWNLSALSGSRLVRHTATTDPRFPAGLQLDVTQAIFSAEPGGQSLLSVRGLGVSGGQSLSQIMSQLQIALPLDLRATLAPPTVVSRYSDGSVKGLLALEPDVAGGTFDGMMVGTVRGDMTFPTQQGEVVFSTSLPMWFEAP